MYTRSSKGCEGTKVLLLNILMSHSDDQTKYFAGHLQTESVKYCFTACVYWKRWPGDQVSLGVSSSSSSVFLMKADDSSCKSSSCDDVHTPCSCLILAESTPPPSPPAPWPTGSTEPCSLWWSQTVRWSKTPVSTGTSVSCSWSLTSCVSAVLLDKKLVSRDFKTCRPKSPTSS